MAVFLTFDGLKAAILANARVFTVCEGYYEAMRTTDYSSFLDAAIPYLVGAYKSLPQILTDDLLAEFGQPLLNEKGIYTANATITNPETEIFIFGAADVTINIDNGQRQTINVLGTSVATVNMSNNSWCRVKTYQTGAAEITLADTSAACVYLSQSSSVILTANSNSSAEIMANGDSQLSVTANGLSFVTVQGFGHSQITTAGTGTIQQRLYELSSNPIPVT